MSRIEATVAYNRRVVRDKFGQGPLESIDQNLKSRFDFVEVSKCFPSGSRAKVVASVKSVDELRQRLGEDFVVDLSNQKFVPF